MGAAAIVGAAQIVQRPGDVPLDAARGPIELMVDVARAAAADAGAPGLLARVGMVGVVGGWFRYRNPAQLVAERIGAPGAATALTAVSGTAPQDLLGVAAERVAAGQLDVALVVGGEARWSTHRIKADGGELPWITEPGEGDPEMLSGFADEVSEEMRRIGSPAAAYALMDDSLRAAAGRTVSDHRDAISALWARFAAVAADNPYAWDRSAMSAADIRDPSPANRMIAFPYTKAMVANNTVDMASALLVCRPEVAREFGVAPELAVYPQVVTSSHETWKVAHRHLLHGAPALAAAGRAAFEHMGIGPADLAAVDLYSCFPAIVEMSTAALGLDPAGPLTLTGGLGFGGGPVGNATGQALAAMVARVRRGGIGMVHGNGGAATKHSFGLYAPHPPETFARIDVQDRVDHRARPELADDWTGPVHVEAATVVYDRQGPSHVLAAVLADGARGWATSRDGELIAAATEVGLAGTTARRHPDGTFS